MEGRPHEGRSVKTASVGCQVSRRMITIMIRDLVEETRRRLAKLAPSSPDDIRAAPEATAAFFDLRNTGGAEDELLRVTTPLADSAMLSRRIVRRGAGSMRMVSSARVPARTTLRMSAEELDVMLRPAPGRLRAGDRVPFVLHFRESGRVRVEAVAVRPGTAVAG